jgi:hypothetical protein
MAHDQVRLAKKGTYMSKENFTEYEMMQEYSKKPRGTSYFKKFKKDVQLHVCACV